MLKLSFSPCLFSLGLAMLVLSQLVTAAYSAGITVTPAYQEIQASGSAVISYTNQSTNSVNLTFTLQKIVATDLLGRLQFNAPLPQTLQDIDPQIAIINPNNLSLEPGQSATVSATFTDNKLNSGSTAFLLLAQIHDPLNVKYQDLGTNLNQYLGSTIMVTAIGGRQTHLELVDFPFSFLPIFFTHPDYFSLTIKNSGNTRSIPRGLIFTTDQFGREVMRGAINSDASAVLPGSQRLIYARLQPAHWSFPISLNRLKFTLADDVSATPILLEKYYLYLHPYFTSGIIVLFGLIIFIKHRNISRYKPK